MPISRMLDAFKSDGSQSTGSAERDGQAFTLVRPLRCTPDDPTVNEVDPDVAGELWLIRFADGVKFAAWSDEIFEHLTP